MLYELFYTYWMPLVLLALPAVIWAICEWEDEQKEAKQ